MKNKSLAWQILSFAVVILGIYGGFFGEKGQILLGLFSFTITALLQSPILSSGFWPTGWSKYIWSMQIGGLLIQVANFLSTSAIVDPQVVNVFIMTVNAILTTFVKEYTDSATK